ncbi:MAG: hypothetical protein FJZ15_02190 [Candidatus Omnitrophica bacterium]|nr:hypothetical protein [Candidatus Omnitrophota bacterium]
MRKIVVVILVFGLFCLGTAFAQYMIGDDVSRDDMMAGDDVNNDGMPDISFYEDRSAPSRIEADTNFDGKPDVIVHTENGKFKSAEIDTDYDGAPDKKFGDVKEFNTWLNDNKPDFKDRMKFNDDGVFTPLRF